MLEFFGLSTTPKGFGFLRKPEGAWSWQHIVLVSFLMLAMFTLAWYFGKKNKGKTDKEKNKEIGRAHV